MQVEDLVEGEIYYRSPEEADLAHKRSWFFRYNEDASRVARLPIENGKIADPFGYTLLNIEKSINRIRRATTAEKLHFLVAEEFPNHTYDDWVMVIPRNYVYMLPYLLPENILGYSSRKGLVYTTPDETITYNKIPLDVVKKILSKLYPNVSNEEIVESTNSDEECGLTLADLVEGEIYFETGSYNWIFRYHSDSSKRNQIHTNGTDWGFATELSLRNIDRFRHATIREKLDLIVAEFERDYTADGYTLKIHPDDYYSMKSLLGLTGGGYNLVSRRGTLNLTLGDKVGKVYSSFASNEIIRRFLRELKIKLAVKAESVPEEWANGTYAVQVKGSRIGKIENIERDLVDAGTITWLEDFLSYRIDGDPEYNMGTEYKWCATMVEALALSESLRGCSIGVTEPRSAHKSPPAVDFPADLSPAFEAWVKEHNVKGELIKKQHQEELAPIFDVEKSRAVIKIKLH